ncbi:hypothetical protein CA85_41860 [Allorhodopirellula solitaria]|uniref:Uncharacterized protein n=1 Tax=Allorhodopirellula solitaria TaxID=2527987 RepID=A0A5C5X2J1_9BACT|nr:hypothetical protein CA85_41860 [Allorhodopirellula solitaria]
MTQTLCGENGQAWFERICTVAVTCEQHDRSVFKLLAESVSQFLRFLGARLRPGYCDRSLPHSAAFSMLTGGLDESFGTGGAEFLSDSAAQFDGRGVARWGGDLETADR